MRYLRWIFSFHESSRDELRRPGVPPRHVRIFPESSNLGMNVRVLTVVFPSVVVYKKEKRIKTKVLRNRKQQFVSTRACANKPATKKPRNTIREKYWGLVGSPSATNDSFFNVCCIRLNETVAFLDGIYRISSRLPIITTCKINVRLTLVKLKLLSTWSANAALVKPL